MAVSLEFTTSHRYDRSMEGIEVTTTLSAGNRSVDLIAKPDTGASYCVFERKYAEILGLDVEAGRIQRFRTVTGGFVAYQHDVTLQTPGIEFSAPVFFAHDVAFNRDVLGRTGWLERLRVGIVDYDRLLLLSPYDS